MQVLVNAKFWIIATIIVGAIALVDIDLSPPNPMIRIWSIARWDTSGFTFRYPNELFWDWHSMIYENKPIVIKPAK